MPSPSPLEQLVAVKSNVAAEPHMREPVPPAFAHHPAVRHAE